MKTYGEWRYSSTIINLGSRSSGQLHVLDRFIPGKESPVPNGYEAEGGPKLL
jgi:hypothetical protein